ncbi:MAG: putative histidine kinase, atypical hybrid, partial [Ramlibacter sp.]|nr:putative histidine kinase, atypical hybrid [Ramlibacter sp.]
MDQATQTPRMKSRKTSPTPSKPGEAGADSRSGRIARPPQAADDDAEARSRQVLAAMMAFSAGDFSTRLPSSWSGVDSRIAEAFNQTIRNAERITGEAARLSTTVGKEGRLSQRMSAPGA